MTLEAELENGSVVAGETKISRSRKRIARVRWCRAGPAVAGSTGGDSRGGSHPDRSWLALHQHYPNLLIGNGGSDRALASHSRIHRQPDDAARRNTALFGRRPCPGDIRTYGPGLFDFVVINRRRSRRRCGGGTRRRAPSRSILARELSQMGLSYVTGNFCSKGMWCATINRASRACCWKNS